MDKCAWKMDYCKRNGLAPADKENWNRAEIAWNTRSADEVIRVLVDALERLIQAWLKDGHVDWFREVSEAEKALAQARKHVST